MSGRQIGDVIPTCSTFRCGSGGVKALTDISFDVKEHEIRAIIIGPNGAGKSSMLNVINGVHHPQEGRIFHGEERRRMEPHMAAMQGIRAPSRTSRCSRA